MPLFVPQQAIGSIAYRNGSQGSLSAGANNKVQLNAEEYDPFGWFDAVTNFRFTPQRPGLYQINGIVTLASGVASTSEAIVYKNGAQALWGGYSAQDITNPALYVSPVTGVLSFNGTTDYAELYAYQPSGASGSIQGTSHATRFSAMWIGYAA